MTDNTPSDRDRDCRPAGPYRTPAIERLIDLAIEEDLGRGDVTTDALGVAGERAVGTVVSRRRTVCCGLQVAGWVVERVDGGAGVLSYRPLARDGELVAPGSALARVVGDAHAMLRAERVVLNFLMRLCGVATLTRGYVEAVAGTSARVVDTRKTTPGWRALDKYAVRTGGGANHRFDLGSGVLIKDNHIAACGSVAGAVQRARVAAPHPLRIEVEVETLAEVDEALAAGAEVLLLDNMSPGQVRQAVARIGGRAMVEVSGGVTLETVGDYARAGAQIISVGALTHSALAADLSLELERAPHGAGAAGGEGRGGGDA